jgi:hypothetical protein
MSAVLEKGLYAKLIAGSTLAKKRVYPRTPQSPTFPLIRYQRLNTSRQQALDGNVGVTEATVQVDCMAESYSDSKTLSDEVRVLLHGYKGAWSTLTARLVTLDSETDFSEQDGDRIIHRVVHRYRVWTDMD